MKIDSDHRDILIDTLKAWRSGLRGGVVGLDLDEGGRAAALARIDSLILQLEKPEGSLVWNTASR